MGITSIGFSHMKEQLVTSYCDGRPNWSYIPSASKNSKSRNEFISEIKTLAGKAATTTDKNELAIINKQVLILRTEYLSDVAPDRKRLYQLAGNVINKNSLSIKSERQGELTLLDFLKDADGKQNLAEKHFALAGGGFLSCPMLTDGGHGAVISYGGTNVLCNIGAGWGYEMTPTELAKKNEFYSVYWKEYHSVKNDLELEKLPDYIAEKNMFDKKA